MVVLVLALTVTALLLEFDGLVELKALVLLPPPLVAPIVIVLPGVPPDQFLASCRVAVRIAAGVTAIPNELHWPIIVGDIDGAFEKLSVVNPAPDVSVIVQITG